MTRTIINWLEKNKDELNLVNTNFKEDLDFQFQLNKRQDSIMMICKCGKKILWHKNKVFLRQEIDLFHSYNSQRTRLIVCLILCIKLF